MRFALELIRGDGARPYVLRLSEAQWTSLATGSAVALATRSMPYAIVAAALVVVAIGWMSWTRNLADALGTPRHLEELERIHRALATRRKVAAVTTSAGLRVSMRPLPSGPMDVLWSHARLGERDVRALVRELSLDAEILPARTEGMFHVLVAMKDTGQHDDAEPGQIAAPGGAAFCGTQPPADPARSSI